MEQTSFDPRSMRWKWIPALIVCAFTSTDGYSQDPIPAGINSLTYSMTDVNGVSLTSFRPGARVDDLSIGSKERPLAHSVFTDDGEGFAPMVRFADSYLGKVSSPPGLDYSAVCPPGTSYLDATLGKDADRMCGTAGVYYPQRGTGSNMVTNPDGSLTYTAPDGTQRLYGVQAATVLRLLLSRITSPDGMITTLTYKSAVLTSGATAFRLQSVTRNDGLQLKYTYASNAAPTSSEGPWSQVASVTALNNTIDYCDPLADSCSYTKSWPTATQSWVTSGSVKYMTLTDAGGRATRFTVGIPVLTGGTYVPGYFQNYLSDQLLAIRRPTSTSADNIVYNYCAVNGELYCMLSGIKSVSVDGVTWTYTPTVGHGGPSTFVQTVVSRPSPYGGVQLAQQQRGNSEQGPLSSYSDNVTLRTFIFESALSNRVQRVRQGDGNELSYVYDGRGNITQETHTPVAGSPLAPAIRTANFDSTCANPVKCNKPNWVRDPMGNQTDYTYDPVHGGVLTMTGPADNFGIRPQVRYGYTQRYAWFKNSSGAVTQAANPVWVLTTEKYCRNSAAAAGGAGCTPSNSDEVTTTYEYGPTSGANNLFLRGKSVTADGVTLRTCYGYDPYGNRISETLPKAGLTSCP